MSDCSRAEVRQTQLSQRVDVLIEDRQFHHETALLLDQEALVSREAWAHSDSLTATLIAQISSLHRQLLAALGQIQALQARDQTHADDPEGAASTANNMPPKRTYVATARAAAAAAIAPMTVVAVEQLIEARVSAALANNETLRNSTNELALMCGRMFHEESYEVEKYVGGLPDMIRGNVMSYQPKTMEKAIEFANDQMGQKVLTIAERQAE
ncbi:hypothetical protein Tco_1118430 [Tanacetum coccineum]